MEFDIFQILGHITRRLNLHSNTVFSSTMDIVTDYDYIKCSKQSLLETRLFKKKSL